MNFNLYKLLSTLLFVAFLKNHRGTCVDFELNQEFMADNPRQTLSFTQLFLYTEIQLQQEFLTHHLLLPRTPEAGIPLVRLLHKLRPFPRRGRRYSSFRLFFFFPECSSSEIEFS